MRRRAVVPTLVFALVAVVVGVAALLRWPPWHAAAPALPPDVGVVDQIIDGDTIDVEIGGRTERIRLIGIDTPEIAHDDGSTDECYGPEATQFTAGQLPLGTEVRLVRDVVGRDDYGRLLAYVFRRIDDLFVNEVIVAAGYARPLTIAPNDAYATDFVAAATAANAAGLGLWAACAG